MTNGKIGRGANLSAGRTAALRCRITPEYGPVYGSLDALQISVPTVPAIDPTALFAGPTFDHLLGIMTGKVALGQDPPDDLPYTLLRLFVERPTAQLPIYREEVGGPVGDPPTLVLDHVCHAVASTCYSISSVIRAARANN
jgi:hypothetical protein